MLSLDRRYARLDIAADQDFNEVAEAIRTLLSLCRLNRLPGALVVSRQNGLDWRSSLRVAIRFQASRGGAPDVRLACVVRHYNDAAREDVRQAAREAGMECQIFSDEAEAIAWLAPKAESSEASDQRS